MVYWWFITCYGDAWLSWSYRLWIFLWSMICYFGDIIFIRMYFRIIFSSWGFCLIPPQVFLPILARTKHLEPCSFLFSVIILHDSKTRFWPETWLPIIIFGSVLFLSETKQLGVAIHVFGLCFCLTRPNTSGNEILSLI